MTTLQDRREAMLWGAFVADAASMGLHWLYDQERIAEVAPEAPEFMQPTASHYEGVPSYFAHPTKHAGDLSHYGAQMLVMLRALVQEGCYDRAAYEAEFASYFGYGGGYVGYIDRPTRSTLDTMAQAIEGDDTRPYPGADDVQLPAVSKLPPLIVCHHGAADLGEVVQDAVRVTNNTNTATRFAATTADLLQHVLQNGTLPELNALAARADLQVSDAITPALDRRADSTQAVTGDIGMSCYLSYGIPSVFHALATKGSFVDAIRANIYAGGDSCGRAIVLGAAMGAVHGIGGAPGIPSDWIDRLRDKEALAPLVRALAERT